ncbi:helix-turn-helix domain-containing protein [Azospirillum sp. SYSU D00513]|uniref:helix-turn-helix domain-containing protein n=1 Tax=Azospirillum sp. SYSU D00513 TaxID=2812561 RepID=UPI001A96DE05|nr:helix-turn-helix domain-containing protein [Azospirillum sp. SYSU D00513]
MSARNLARHFVQEMGITPHEFVEGARIDAAHRLLEGSGRALKSAAHDCGFGTADQMRNVFGEKIGVAPAQYHASFHQPDAEKAFRGCPTGRRNSAPPFFALYPDRAGGLTLGPGRHGAFPERRIITMAEYDDKQAGKHPDNTHPDRPATDTPPPHPAPMSSDPKLDNITGDGEKPQYDAGEEP